MSCVLEEGVGEREREREREKEGEKEGGGRERGVERRKGRINTFAKGNRKIHRNL